ncbi:MAG: hypothetical protein WDM80_06225 [Limisphaerales bacterium]
MNNSTSVAPSQTNHTSFHQKQQGHGAFNQQRGAKNLFAGKFAEQKHVDLVAADETNRQRGKDGAKFLRADVKHFHENDWRTSHIDEQP